MKATNAAALSIIRRLFSVFLSALICLSFFTSFAVSALAAETEEEKVSIFVSIYNDIEKEFYVTNTSIQLPVNKTPEDALDVLKELELILDYTLSGTLSGSITSLTLIDKTELKIFPPPQSQAFYLKLNGVVQASQLAMPTLKEGDILEIIYGESIKSVIVPSESNGEAEAVASTAPVSWDESLQGILSDACDYLNLTAEADVAYLVALGCAGRSPDLKKLNSALGLARRNVDNTSPLALAGVILAMTFTGYDASEQIARLSEIPLDDGINTAIAVLLAYDSYDYKLDENAINTREGLINYLLEHQNADGSFTEDPKSDAISVTARVITVLSGYRSSSRVPQAIDRAISYLADKYTDNVGYNNSVTGAVDSTLNSRVIVALVSTGLGLYDERFMSGDKTLIDLLIENRNPDGGFSVKIGETSDSDSTIRAVVAFSAAKKNKYPYIVSQKLAPPTQTTPTQQLVDTVKNLSIEELVLAGVVVFTVIAVVIISVVSRFSKRNRKPKKT